MQTGINKEKMKNPLIIIITIISIGISVNWMIKTDYEYEPVIVTLGLITFLIGFFTTQKISNKSTIKGNYNNIDQTNGSNNMSDILKENQSKIDGDNNDLKQKN